jgi:hypothetical protein
MRKTTAGLTLALTVGIVLLAGCSTGTTDDADKGGMPVGAATPTDSVDDPAGTGSGRASITPAPGWKLDQDDAAALVYHADGFHGTLNVSYGPAGDSVNDFDAAQFSFDMSCGDEDTPCTDLVLVTINGLDAREFTRTVHDHPELFTRYVFITKGDTEYSIFCQSTSDRDLIEADCETMINSFTLVG